MSRHENENVDFLNLPDPDPVLADYYLSDGSIISRDEYLKLKKPPRVCAKAVQNQETKIVTYFILCNNRNQMYDPRESDGRYFTRNWWKFRRVLKSTFEIYIKFLKQKYTSLLTQAERGL